MIAPTRKEEAKTTAVMKQTDIINKMIEKADQAASKGKELLKPKLDQENTVLQFTSCINTQLLQIKPKLGLIIPLSVSISFSNTS